MKLTGQEIEQVRAALADARAGKATVGQLGAAHDLAVRGVVPACVEEIRQHLRAMLARPGRWGQWTLGKDLAVSVAAGIVTHHLLGKTSP